MKTYKITPVVCIKDDAARSFAAELFINEEVIALPTDTVYGLACSANSPSAIKKLYEIKGRDETKPVAICVSNFEELRKWGHAEHLPESFLQKILPGAVTLVFEKTPLLDNPFLNPHTTKIGIRIPDYEFIRSVCSLSGIPIALTSANPSSIPSSLSIREFESLFPKLGAVFDGGMLGEGLQETRVGSTVVDVSRKGFYRIIREGIACDQTLELLHSYEIFPDHR